MGGRLADGEPALSSGCGGLRRIFRGERPVRSRAQPARNRAQLLADYRNRPRADSTPYRCRGAPFQSAGHERRDLAARTQPTRAPAPATTVNPSEWRPVMNTGPFVKTSIGLVGAVSA